MNPCSKLEHLCYNYIADVCNRKEYLMNRTKSPHQETQIIFHPSIIVRSALIMSIFVIIACLFLTSGMTLVNADSANPQSGPISTGSNDSAPANAAATIPEGDCQVSGSYPESVLQWCALITKYANQANLPPDLIAGLIWYESGGNPTAYSHSGAVGLMQVMPRDGIAADFQCPNGPCFASRPSIAELQDPEFNIQYGTRMLAGLYARYQDMRAALRSYGPKDVGNAYADKLLAIYERYRGN